MQPTLEAELERAKKRLVGIWRIEVFVDGQVRSLDVQYRADGTQIAWGFVNGKKIENPRRWEALQAVDDRVRKAQILRVRTSTDGANWFTFEYVRTRRVQWPTFEGRAKKHPEACRSQGG